MAAAKRSKKAKKIDSRDQSTRDADSREAFEFDPSVLEDLGPLPNIQPRNGYAQRWVRVMIGKEVDARNMATRARRGWRPRQSDTIDPSFRYMTTNREEFGNVIGVSDCVLMERPIEVQRKVEAHERQKVLDMSKAIKHNLFREHSNLGGNQTGFEAPRDESKSQVLKGSPILMED